MIRAISVFLICICFFQKSNCKGGSVINFSNGDYIALAKGARFLEDKESKLDLKDVLKLFKDSLSGFQIIKEEQPNLNFTASSYWVVFKTPGIKGDFLLEAAMPITNVVDLYEPLENNKHIFTRGGDEIPFLQRRVNHRKNLFPVQLNGIEKLMVLHLKSDGEVIKLPIRLWHPDALLKKDYKDQLIIGIYYGVLLLTTLIFFFFYLAVKIKTLLFYVLYVLSLMILQLSLDGLAFQYLWPNAIWWANHVTLISACLSVFFINKYAVTYLKLKENLKGSYNVFQGIFVLSLVLFTMSLTGGKIYSWTFPAINFLGLFSTILILFTIVTLVIKKHKINLFFILAILSLICGSTIFILANINAIENTIFTDHAIKIGSAIEVFFLSLSMAQNYRNAHKEKVAAQGVALEKLREINELKEKHNLDLEQQVNERTAQYLKQKEEIAQKNKDITDSINYARRIQQAILPDLDEIKKVVPEVFVYYKPKDIVSGDFYFIEPIRTNDGINLVGFSVADCTGHGVPGAFMSMLGVSFLRQSLTAHSVNNPAQALDFLNENINLSLKKRAEDEVKDGMDMAFCVVNLNTLELQYAGANNPLWILNSKRNFWPEKALPPAGGEGLGWTEVRPDKQPIGYFENHKQFTNHKIQLQKGDTVYLFSDGYADQFGGHEGKKFKQRQFKELLLSIQGKAMDEQHSILSRTFDNWKGNLEQIDDVCVIGIRV